MRKRRTAELAAQAARAQADSVGGGLGTPLTTAPDSQGMELPFQLTDDTEMETGVAANETEGDTSLIDPDALLLEISDRPEPAAGFKEPATEELLDRAASEALDRGEPMRAVGIYSELLKLNQKNVKARNNLALLLDQEGDHEGALEALDRCVSDEPANVQVLVNRGAILGSLTRYIEAEGDLGEAVRLDPASAEGHFNLGIVSVRRGLWAEAVPYLRRAVELDAGRAAAYFYLGEALNHVDDLQGALQSYQRATELQPTKPEYLYGLGIILDRLNRPDDAAQMYRRSREAAGR